MFAATKNIEVMKKIEPETYGILLVSNFISINDINDKNTGDVIIPEKNIIIDGNMMESLLNGNPNNDANIVKNMHDINRIICGLQNCNNIPDGI